LLYFLLRPSFFGEPLHSKYFNNETHIKLK
jgi:hypothetical protein